MAIKINVTSVMVDDQAKALKFYTEALGFEKKHDVPVGEHRWLTVIAPAGAHGMELLLEPNVFPAAKVYQKALFDAGVYTNVALHPAVPPGGALHRTSVMATHRREHLDRALETFGRVLGDFPDVPRSG